MALSVTHCHTPRDTECDTLSHPRYGIPIAMIGGMVKQDCADPTDTGDYCWSEDVEAQVLGAYFYGYTLQLLTVILIKRYVGKR